MRRDILLLLGAAIFASAAGYTYLHNDNLQVSAGVIFIGTFLLSWANPKRFLVYALVTGSSIFIANLYATTNQLDVPAPPGGIAEVFLAFIPAVVAGIGGMIIGGGVSNLPDKLGRPTDAARAASLEASADMEGSGAEPYDASRPAREAQAPPAPPSGTISGLENTPRQEPRPFA
ncbi:MAG: hypothetical protein ACR2L6_13955 [Gemmatimonadaceae bacterium]